MIDLSIKIGGAAGQGLQTVGALLGKAFVRGGYQVLAVQDTMSRIRGGHNTFQIRVKDGPVRAMCRGVDLLVALDRESLEVDMKDLKPGGIAICDRAALKVEGNDPRVLDAPLEKLAVAETGKKVAANVVSTGVVLGLLDFGTQHMEKLVADGFGTPELAQGNVRAVRAGHDLARKDLASRFAHPIRPATGPRRMLLTANDAICLGAIAAGCRFMSAYPMSPSTSILTYLAGSGDRVGLVTEQAEDEIAAINLALGASMGGVRAMTATSGGGFALMVETLSMLGVSEVPLVIVDCQRPGPATGLPTKTEQADLMFVIHAGHGEFPRAVLAPGDARQAFEATVRAFNLADRYQVPAVVLGDQFLADSYFTCEPFDLSGVPFETSLLSEPELAALPDYRRYAVTDSGVSPRAFPGQGDRLVMTDSHEHDEHGHIAEDPATRTRMNDKRLRKGRGLAARMGEVSEIGPRDARTALVGFGSTLGVLVEAAGALTAAGRPARVVHLCDVWPFPAATVEAALRGADEIVVVENNATGQLAGLVCAHTSRRDPRRVLKHDGGPFLVEDLAARLAKTEVRS
ncbi:MAG: 2-oxoacid:acceptor oxidoreductase subunit alpha [Deltaproteobacteria bacterium]|nr:2-oxoacid:acceptor oxidoreductase subunit alpha [Deltaproteobacteria bacterium]